MNLEVVGVSKTFRGRQGQLLALENVSFTVASGEFICILGPSGCGKSTLLSLIAGLDLPDKGEILVQGVPVTGPGRDRVVIFQEAALFPWLSVLENVAFGLELAGMAQVQRREKARQCLHLVGLHAFHKAYVHELSGGMKQRVALARALALEPQVLLMDEPFAALDAISRDDLHHELQSIWWQTGTTIVFVTHNVREALVLGDRTLLMTARPGRIKAIFRYDQPRPRHMEDHAMVDVAREIVVLLRQEASAAEEAGSD
jgi:NitT/TauT family transport system ATP-binding protein